MEVVGKIEPGCGTLTLCDSRCVDPSSDLANCGRCDHACGVNQHCSAGACKGPACNANLHSDPKNCGTCGHVCPEGICSLGRCCEKCRCLDGFTTGACAFSTACEHVCRAHEPH